mmetsp:Transcript_65527/g.188534  ORF Transcript_65527/g.188534 Transcript_65527/m.188534 type:complete len:118 (-) Transcript_65527:75-428(-)
MNIIEEILGLCCVSRRRRASQRGPEEGPEVVEEPPSKLAPRRRCRLSAPRLRKDSDLSHPGRQDRCLGPLADVDRLLLETTRRRPVHVFKEHLASFECLGDDANYEDEKYRLQQSGF